MKLDKLIKACREHFLTGISNDPQSIEPLTLGSACYEVVAENVVTVKTAQKILSELTKRNFPAPYRAETGTADQWCALFVSVITQSIEEYLSQHDNAVKSTIKLRSKTLGE